MNELKDWAPLFGSDTRDAHEIKLEDLETVNVPFSQYGITEGEELHFDNDAKFLKQDADDNNRYPSYRMTCLRNGRKSYFDPGFVNRRDIDGNYIYPDWAALGSAAEVAKNLIKLGTIKGGKSFSVNMRQRRNGVAVQEAVRKENGDLDLNDDGTPKMKDVAVVRQYPSLPKPLV